MINDTHHNYVSYLNHILWYKCDTQYDQMVHGSLTIFNSFQKNKI